MCNGLKVFGMMFLAIFVSTLSLMVGTKGCTNSNFFFLNHFRYKHKISFPFYLHFSLLQSLHAHRKKESQPILHEGQILLIEGFCKNKSIVSSPSTGKHKDSQSIKCKIDENVKGKDKEKLKPSSSQRQIIEEDIEVESTEGSDKDVPEEQEGIDVGEFSSNLEGYSKMKGKNEKGREEETTKNNSEQRKFDNEGTQTMFEGADKDKDNLIDGLAIISEEENMGKASTPVKETKGQDKEVPSQHDPMETGEEPLDGEEQIDKVGSPPHTTTKDMGDSPERETKLSFLHSAKLKADSFLQVDSWICNKIMGLKKKVETLQHNQEAN